MSIGQHVRVMQHLRRALSVDGDVGDGELLDAFLSRRDEVAFGALMRRHGPMVWGVCRRLAGQLPDAEDAFQAVFLILVRNGERVWPRDRVGAWLHGVAFRTARKARRLADRRRAREKQVADMPHPISVSMESNGDLNPILDEELGRLPEKLRLPVVLCDLEGRTQREVAKQLQLPVGTLCHRLASARRRLARRLSRRGVTLAMAGAALAVPKSLSAATSRSALLLATGRELASLVPPQIVTLTEGVLSMTPTKCRLAAVMILTVVLGGLGWHARSMSNVTAAEADPPASKPATANDVPVDDRTFLRRLSMDLRGLPPTELEFNYFLADADAGKRRKVAAWMLEPSDKTKTRVQYYEDAFRAQTELSKSSSDPQKQANELELRLRMLAGESSKQANSEVLAKWYKALQSKADSKTTPEDIEKQRTLDRLKEAQKEFERATDLTANDQIRDEYSKLIETLRGIEKQTPPNDPEAAKRLVERIRRFEELMKKPQPKEPSAKVADLFEKVRETQTLDPRTVEGTDAEFLRRVFLDIAGKIPTTVEMNYFVADKDPNKRQKIVGWLEKQNPKYVEALRSYYRAKGLSPTQLPGRFDKLLGELLTGSRSEAQILESLTLATLARLPTESERAFATAYVKGQTDRRGAWDKLLNVLVETQEYRQHVDALYRTTRPK